MAVPAAAVAQFVFVFQLAPAVALYRSLSALHVTASLFAVVHVKVGGGLGGGGGVGGGGLGGSGGGGLGQAGRAPSVGV